MQLIDFGLATVLPKGKKAFTVCGTRYYFAPEMIKRKCGYTTSVDVWAFGLMVYEFYTGWTPFMSTQYKVEKRQMNQEILQCEQDGTIPYERTDADFPLKHPEAWALIKRCLVAPRSRMTPQECCRTGYFSSMDWSALNSKQVKVPFRPSMLEHRKNVAQKEAQKLSIPPYTGPVITFAGW